MKQIIDGKRYNTETATKVASYWNGLSRGEFDAIEENLYVTKNGNWFFEYYGGAGTEYSEWFGNSASEGSGIKPLTPDEVSVWLEQKEEVEALEEYFSDDIENA